MPAVAKILRLKSTNAIVPCRACRIIATRDPNGGRHAHYYAALHIPSGPSYEPLNLPLRTHDEFMRQGLDIAMAEARVVQDNLAIQYGIHGVPILTTLSSISVPASFPHDFMHILENIIPMLVSHWTGTFKCLDVGSESYEIPKTVWEAIGEACAASGSTIPTAFGARVPNVATQRYQFIAETWILFATFVGPVVLHDRFTQPVYYEHFVSLVKLINLCVKLEISQNDLEEIEKGFAAWVVDYERLVTLYSVVILKLILHRIYYQHDLGRLSACTMPVHALLHIADDIRRAGPVWCYWAFAMERYCGLLAMSGKSRRHPFVSLSRRIRDIEQLNQVKVKYNLADTLNLRRNNATTSESYTQCESFLKLSDEVVYIPHIDPDIAMMHPYRVSRVDNTLRRKIASHLVTNNQSQQKVSVSAMLHFIPTEIPQWFKMKISSRGDVIRTTTAVGNGEREVRDNTFVKVRNRFPWLSVSNKDR